MLPPPCRTPNRSHMETKNNVTYCYVFHTGGTLVHYFKAADTVSSVPEMPMLSDKANCFARQQAFYTALSPEDAASFEAFCRSGSGKGKSGSAKSASVPSLLLFSDTGAPAAEFTAVFSERYTSQLLTHKDPLPGAVANRLGQAPVQQLKTIFPNKHLILSLLFSCLSELYSTTSPILAEVPPLVQELVKELEAIQNPAAYTDTLPFLKSYQTELKAADTPVFLDLVQILPRLTAWLPGTPMFSGLQLQYLAGDSMPVPELYQVRFPVSAFTYIFVLLSYMFALLSDDGPAQLFLYRSGTDACLTFQAETDSVPPGFVCRSELQSLSRHLPGYKSLLIPAQYLLHRSAIPFTCQVNPLNGWPVLELTLRMDTRFREEIEFRCGDMDDLLAENLPDALSLLQYLTEPPAEAQAEQ